MIRQTLFISDLHLQENSPEITDKFFRLLKRADKNTDAIYILGDLFEFWIGDDDDTPFHRSIINALRAAHDKGIPIYFMHGNRDFLIGKKFLKASGCQLLKNDEEPIQLYQTPVLLMHGDTLCTLDTHYLKWRNRCKNPILHTLFFLSLPLFIRRKIAERLRSRSRNYKRSIETNVMDVTQEAVESVMRKHDVQYLIHGHTHKPNIHSFQSDGFSKTRIVLDAWHDKGSALVWYDNGEHQLIDF